MDTEGSVQEARWMDAKFWAKARRASRSKGRDRDSCATHGLGDLATQVSYDRCPSFRRVGLRTHRQRTVGMV